MVETYDALLKMPMDKKECTLTIDRQGDGTFEGTFTVFGSTAPIVDGKIDDDGNFTCAFTITTIMGTTDAVGEGRVFDGKIDGKMKNKMGIAPIKSADLW